MLKLTYSNLGFQNFPGEDPRTLHFKGREGKGGEGGEREGKGGEGRRGGMGGREGTGGGLDMGSAPLETSSESAPGRTRKQTHRQGRLQ